MRNAGRFAVHIEAGNAVKKNGGLRELRFHIYTV